MNVTFIGAFNDIGKNTRKPPGSPRDGYFSLFLSIGVPLDISDAEGIELLSTNEKNLCSILRILPRLYLTIKETLIATNARYGHCKRAQARSLIKIDVNKTSRIYDFFIGAGWIKPRPDKEGTSSPSEGNMEEETTVSDHSTLDFSETAESANTLRSSRKSEVKLEEEKDDGDIFSSTGMNILQKRRNSFEDDGSTKKIPIVKLKLSISSPSE